MIPTVSPADAQPGDAVACHSRGFVGLTIRLGQFIRWWTVWRRRNPHWREAVQYNHIAKLHHRNESGEWIVNQAAAHGTGRAPLSDVAPGGRYVIIPLSAFPTVDSKPVDRERTLAESDRLIGVGYGFVTDAAIGLNMLTPRVVDITRPGTLICSSYASLADHAGGIAIDTADCYQTTPAEYVGLAIPKVA